MNILCLNLVQDQTRPYKILWFQKKPLMQATLEWKPFTYFAARGALLFLVDPRSVPVQVRQLHAERVGRGLRPQPHGHESRAVRDL